MQIFLNKNTRRQCQQRITEFLSHIRVLNHVIVKNVAIFKSRNGYNQYYFALDSTFFETRPRSGRCQMLKAEANLSRPKPRSIFWPRVRVSDILEHPVFILSRRAYANSSQSNVHRPSLSHQRGQFTLTRGQTKRPCCNCFSVSAAFWSFRVIRCKYKI